MITGLSKSNENQISETDIFIYPYSLKYLNDLKIDFPGVYANITAVIEPNDRYRKNDASVRIISPDEFKTVYLGKIGTIKSAANMSLIITDDYYEELLPAIEAALPDFANIFYYLDHASQRERQYRTRYENKPLENKIIFRSGPHESQYVRGADFADNARALFEYMLKAGINKEYELIWLVKYPREFEHIAGEYDNVKFISIDDKNEEYYEALFNAKIIFMTDAYGFSRNCRKGQVRIQLWHGCGFKTRTNFSPCRCRYEYNIVIGEKYKKIHEEIYGLESNQVVITGYPKADWLFEKSWPEKFEKMNIPKVKKTIFWLPTFRKAKGVLGELNEAGFKGDTGLPVVKTHKQLMILDEKLKAANAILIVKLHPFQDENEIHIEDTSNIILIKNEDMVEADVQINQILAGADALISDYSSAATEFLLLDRPMGFCLEDVLEYEESRGFVFDNIRDWLPGEEIFTFGEFSYFIDEVILERDISADKRRKIRNLMYTYPDGDSCSRVTQWALSLIL